MERTTQPKRSIPPVGYRFHPTDAELVGHFLNKKSLASSDNQDMPIAEVKICDFEPWNLPDQSKIKSNDKVWYFFCPRDFKYLNSRRSKRTTKAGYWKPTGKPRKVKAIGSKTVIGTKRSLVFYEKGQANSKPVKSKWIMHEYENIPLQGNFLICKLKAKLNENIKKVETKEIAPASASASASTPESMMTVYSSCGEHEPSDDAGADFERHDMDEMPAVSTYDNGEQSCPMVFPFGSPNQNEVTSDFVCYESEMAAKSIYRKGKYDSRETSIFKSRILVNKIDILVSEEGEYISLAATPNDLSAPPVAADLEVNAAQAQAQASTLDVEGPSTFFDDMETLFEPEDSLNSVLFSPNGY